jgi:hypothetical protein
MLMASTVFADTLEQRDIVFYYGSRPPVEDLRHFDQIVIQPSQILPHEKTALLNLDSLIFAYISFGEIARNSEDMPRIKTKWSIGVNPAWNSLVMNMNDPAWLEYLLEHHFGRLWREGYRAFFLDTVDSYMIVTTAGKQREEQETGVVALLAEVKRRFPGCKLILNRGFEVLDRASQYTDGMVAESLFHGFDPVTGKHAPTREENRGWLLKQLRRAQDEFNVPITVLDYVEPGNWAEAEKTAQSFAKTLADLKKLGQNWLESPNKAATVDLLYRASQTESSTAFLEISEMVIRESRSTGAGTRLMRATAARLLARGHRTLSLGVVQGNTAAGRFYEHLGGTMTGREPATWADGVWHDVYRWSDIAAIA